MIRSMLMAIGFIAASLPFSSNQQTIETGATMETSNVFYDMMCLYGEDVFNPADPDFDGVERRYSSFKFYAAKPYQDDVYLYMYFSSWPETMADDYPFTVKYSTSTDLDADNFIVEDFKITDLEYVNHYGFINRYLKYRVNGVFDIAEDEQFRIRIESIGTGGTFETPPIIVVPRLAVTPYSKRYDIAHEVSFEYDDSDDLVYEYFGTEYITITEKLVAQNIIGYGIAIDPFGNADILLGISSPIPAVTNRIYYSNYYENSYCFFDTDKEIDRIMEIEFVYSVFGYTAKVGRNGAGWFVGNDIAYTGLYGKRDGYEFVVTEPGTSFRKTVENELVSVTRVESSFFGWVTYADYKYETLIDVSKSDELTDDDFKGFVERAAVKDDGTDYQWGFNVHASDRTSVVSDYFSIGFWSWWNTTTIAHEVKQAMILRIKYVNDDMVFDLNAWDVPTDTSLVVVTVPSTFTVFDESTLPSWLQDIIAMFKEVGMWMAIAAIVVAGGFLVYLTIRTLMSFRKQKAIISNTKRRR